MTRREWLKLAALFTATGAAPFLSSLNARAAADPDAPVRIGYLPITDAAPLLVAHNNGYFQSEGLNVEQPTLFHESRACDVRVRASAGGCSQPGY